MSRSTRPHGWFRPTLLALALVGLLAGTASCSGGGDTPASGGRSTARPAAGATPHEDGCARVISAIGWTDFMLVRPGHEDEQNFRSGVRGRLSYVDGTVKLYGDALPPQAVEPAKHLQRVARHIVDLGSDRAERVAGLKEYRRAVSEVKSACARSADG